MPSARRRSRRAGRSPSPWSLTVEDGVRLDPARLADLPALVRLKIGDVDGDVIGIGALHRLRVLIATPPVWQRLRERDVLPRSLAAVGAVPSGSLFMSGNGMTVAETAAWSALIASRFSDVHPTRVIDIEDRFDDALGGSPVTKL